MLGNQPTSPVTLHFGPMTRDYIDVRKRGFFWHASSLKLFLEMELMVASELTPLFLKRVARLSISFLFLFSDSSRDSPLVGYVAHILVFKEVSWCQTDMT